MTPYPSSMQRHTLLELLPRRTLSSPTPSMRCPVRPRTPMLKLRLPPQRPSLVLLLHPSTKDWDIPDLDRPAKSFTAPTRRIALV